MVRLEAQCQVQSGIDEAGMLPVLDEEFPLTTPQTNTTWDAKGILSSVQNGAGKQLQQVICTRLKKSQQLKQRVNKTATP